MQSPEAEVDSISGRVVGCGQRETAVLDLFIAAKVREDTWLDETELHLEREETFKDLFDLSQVCDRLPPIRGTLANCSSHSPVQD
jgi:hypothetical protein